jgi:large subunit ribosomal protein L23
MQDLYQVIKSISLTEKATLLGEQNNEFVFKVSRKTNKVEIKQAVEKIFGKKVVGVRTLNVTGKERRAKRADAGRTNHWKKAIVRLADGERIDLV